MGLEFSTERNTGVTWGRGLTQNQMSSLVSCLLHFCLFSEYQLHLQAASFLGGSLVSQDSPSYMICSKGARDGFFSKTVA